ncbi:hypothetical protein BWZ22_13080 [Seonamhaeicola sp. S2-3]|uniref:hypothetical protein n=1 Tax=Seonamhaeicola sp. S2-3 TaxID=1936081 RepID=UPI00097276E5|nr:hypothetical protein [Seonamhaeicola sp. S2-3]APY12106.1 hypothetical protein BWZ22_13080 [Seonamhaeicola sp. S2-3]
MSKNVLIEDQYKRTSLFEKENVNYLVRVLKRFNTVPKINSINIIASSKEPSLFKIIPGKAIKIGELFLEQPVLALIYLRYGIEWQIWYKALGKDKNNSILCDLAALKVTQIFYNLLQKRDKEKLKNCNYFLINIIKHNTDFNVEFLSKYSEFQFFHGIATKNKTVKDDWQSILENLAVPTEYLLMSGGDLRLNVDEKELLNKYGCRPFPRPEAFTFASSTATSISNFAYDRTDKARTILIQKSLKNGFEKSSIEFTELLKSNLRKALKINEETQIIFSPSGTDSALQIAAITQIVTKQDITHILVASDETGSGVPAALKGCHFENTTALNYPVKKGDTIEGFREVDVIKIPLKDEHGDLKSDNQLDNEVFNAVTKTNALGRHAVLHVMDQSKLGCQSPTTTLLENLKTIDNVSLQVIVDGSQLRLDPKDVQNYLNKGYIVTITGSKFFTGPPYAGALIIPKSVSEVVESVEKKLPEGLNNYYNSIDWPQPWFCSKDLSDGFNYGSYMRWNAAIVEMDRYYKTPILYRNLGIEMFCNFVKASINDAPFLQPLFGNEAKINMYNKEEFGLRNIRTIFPFFILKNNEVLSLEQVKKLYVLLNSDLSNEFEGAPIETVRLAAQKCHIGQAVNAKYHNNQSAVLRISLGARVISESWVNRDISIYFRNIESQMDQVTIIIKKIELLLDTPRLFN